MRNNSYKLNVIMNIIFKKRVIRRSYPNIHLHIKYVRSFKKSGSILTDPF